MTREYFDNTILSSYRKCPRFYYLRHKMHWRGEGVAAPLAFGLAWHEAMNVIWPGYNRFPKHELLELAQYAFEQTWVDQGMPPPTELSIEQLEKLGARTPMTAYDMLSAYVEEREAILAECELLSVEQPFAVPLWEDPDKPWYIGRLDKAIQTAVEGVVIEHKTTSDFKKDGGFRQTYIDQWSPNTQIEGYLFGAAMTYGRDKMRQVWVDAALVHKNERRFKFIPISIASSGLDQWLVEAREWVTRLLADEMYPRNTANCIDFGSRCQFFDVCRSSHALPALGQPVPPGFVHEEWKPFDILGVDKIIAANAPTVDIHIGDNDDA